MTVAETKKAKATDLEAQFTAAGYSIFSFTPAEQGAISAKIRKLMDENPSRNRRQAIAIAISMVAPSKAKGEAEGSFSATIAGAEPIVAVAPAPVPKIQIKGGDYRWRDTKDGFRIIYSVPLMATVKKGTKGAPYDVDQPELEHYVRIANERYHQDHFLPTVFVNHNKDIELSQPQFVGYVLPRYVATSKLENESGEMVDTPTLFGDLKLKSYVVDQIGAGEYPYHSPELPWAKRRISGLALLNSKPPFFEFPNFTLGAEVTDDSSYGTFEGANMSDIKPEPIGRFDADADGDASLKKLMGRMDAFEAEAKARYAAFTSFEAKFAAFAKKFEGEAGNMADTKVDTDTAGSNSGAAPAPGTTVPVLKGKAEGEGDGDGGKKGKKGTFSLDDKGNLTLIDSSGKPLPIPVEPKLSASMDAAFVANFEASQSQLKLLMEERAKEKDDMLKRSRLDWAKDELKGKILSPTFGETMGQFALDEPKFKSIVEEMKKSLPSKPPTSIADFHGVPVDTKTPSVAKFAQLGPEAGEKAAKFAADYRALRAAKIPLSSSEEEYVKFQMESAQAMSA